MNFLIERAVHEDYQIMADVIQSVWRQIERKDWFVADDSEYTCHTLQEGNGIGYKAFEMETNALAGVLIASLPGKGEENLGWDIGMAEEELGRVAHMESVAILPKYRGNGLQHTLMKIAEEELRNHGYRYLMCTVHPENKFSKNNMIKQGYQVVLTKEKYGGYLRDILYKELL
ncbi:GNAT family N-acetyltransferase [Lacrimispora saccharolytica]|uniref:GCN5-related N-acetyltransferase n=1 Tax=Lacrimispora saccharolytica (strain ATCC 35040 / DSM 2544 / NRCC 2533 / WM1) TaxID=610130 RepID=D9R7U0_LACSW|nr:GNAT family N-acetyltransferase [Lacrimispora saccharolytica]ADL05594.1 GCN5-related N-acetyltransferase [[Clostridium] saccharolyticum WM1]QRV20249.1 N-acetyltransferase [Lacrimispora saccharolytica]